MNEQLELPLETVEEYLDKMNKHQRVYLFEEANKVRLIMDEYEQEAYDEQPEPIRDHVDSLVIEQSPL